MQLANLIIALILKFGYGGIFLLSAGESCLLPIPSEVILPFAGYLVFKGQMSFWLAVLASSLGQLLGSIIAYFIGLRFGRSFVLRYGHYFLISKSRFSSIEHWFGKYGSVAIFFSRLLPAIRTVASLPAGIAKMPLKSFLLWSSTGIGIWTILLVSLGVILGETWQVIISFINKAQIAIIAAALVILLWEFWKCKNENKTTA